MRTRLAPFTIQLLALSTLTACSGPKVFTNQDPGADFGAYRTYGFMDRLDTEGAEYGAILGEFLKLAAGRELEARGYARSDEPDLLVNFYIETQVKERTQQSGRSYHHRRPRYGGYTGYGTETNAYTEGTLHVDLVDRRRNQLAWEGVLVETITQGKRHKLRETCDEAMSEIFARYAYVAGVSVPVEGGS